MRQFRSWGLMGWVWLGACALATLLSGASSATAQRGTADPVEELRKVLKGDVDVTNAADVKDRRSRLEARAAELRTVSDLRRALLLQEWRSSGLEAEGVGADREVRQEIAQRLQKVLGAALLSDDSSVRLAAVAAIGEMGVSVRGAAGQENFTRGLTPELIRLIQKDTSPVREAAARALGQVHPDPDKAAPALGELLHESDVGVRRAGADGLAGMLRTIAQTPRESRTGDVVPTPISRAEAANVGRAVLTVISPALGDADPEVRGLGLGTVQLAAGLFALPEMLPGPFRAGELKLNSRAPEDVESLADARQQVARERAEFLPLARALGDQTPAVAKALQDSRPENRLIAARVLEAIANGRVLLARRRNSLPASSSKPDVALPRDIVVVSGQVEDEFPRLGQPGHTGGRFLVVKVPAPASTAAPDKGLPPPLAPVEPPPGTPGKVEPPLPLPAPRPVPGTKENGDPEQVLLESLEKVLPALERALTDEDVRVRLAVVDTLETMEGEVLPALPALVQALADPDRFVRWATARTLGKLDPDKAADRTVPALSRLLNDPDIDVRLAAITTLGHYGAAAARATPALSGLLSCGDAEVRMAAAHTLENIGAGARGAVPALIGILNHPDARVRRTAAEALGKFGPTAAAAVPALRQLINDPEPEVRQAASDAILDILHPVKKEL